MMTALTIVRKLKQHRQGVYMKALVIASVLFFSLRAMSSEIGEDQKGECPYLNQSSKREAKVVEPVETEATKVEGTKVISK